MKQETTVYGQLAFDFGFAITPDEQEGGECEIIPISATRSAVKGRGANSKFSAFFKEHIPEMSWLMRSFDNMETAEEEISAGFKRYPHRAPAIDRVFPALYSTQVLGTIGHDLYLAHIRSLINRVGEGEEDLTMATDAEVIAGIYGVTLITPTKKFVGQAYWHLFQKMLPRQAMILEGDMDPFFAMPSTAYEKDQVFDFIEGIRKKLRIKDRALSDPDRRAYGMSLSLRRFYRENRRYAPTGFSENDRLEVCGVA